MEVNKDLICIICCSSDCEDLQGLSFLPSRENDKEVEDREEEISNEERFIFKQFCRQLLSIQKLEVERSLSVCYPCLTKMSLVLQAKAKVDVVEGRVRKLQLSILLELKELQGLVGSLEAQLKKIQHSVRGSNVEVIPAGNGKRSRGKRGQMEKLEVGNGAASFRNSILEVSTNLHLFWEDLSSKYPIGPIDTASMPIPINCLGNNKPLKIESLDPVPWMEVEDINIDALEKHDKRVLMSGINEDKEDDKYGIGVRRSTRSPKKSTVRNRNEDKGRASPLPKPLATTSKARQSQRTKSIQSRISVKKMLLSDDDDDDNPGGDHNEDDYDYKPFVNIDDDKGPPSPSLSSASSLVSLKIKEPKMKFYGNTAIERIDFSGMSNFRKYVIRSLLNKTIPQILEPLDSLDSNTAEYHLNLAEQERLSAVLEYDPQIDKIHLKGVEIHLHEQEKIAECSMCSYQFQITWPAKSQIERDHFVKGGKRKFKTHILNNHYKDYNCPVCPPHMITTSYKLEPYILHLKTHLNVHPHTCSICGRPVTNVIALKDHLRTHMNAEEKEEADSIMGGSSPKQCSVCGKILRDKAALKEHMRNHKPKETVLCTNCGKGVNKRYFKIHREKFCGEPKEVSKFKCLLCDKAFKVKQHLGRHVQRIHSRDAVDRPYRCHVCPSSFKGKWDLTNHMKIHVDENIYKCEKGCGRDFATKRNWKRHQESCKGVRREKKRKERQLKKEEVKAEDKM